MTDEQRQDYARRQAEAVRAMAPEEMAERQARAAFYPRNAGHPGQAAGMRNAWGSATVQGGEFMPAKPPPSWWDRIKTRLRGSR